MGVCDKSFRFAVFGENVHDVERKGFVGLWGGPERFGRSPPLPWRHDHKPVSRDED